MTRQKVDLDLLHQVSADVIGIYDRVQRSQALHEEAMQVVAAEQLLRDAGLAYLGADSVESEPGIGSLAGGMVSGYIQIQEGYADLKRSLYQMAKAGIANKEWDKADMALEALAVVAPEYEDSADLRPDICVKKADDLWRNRDKEASRECLRNGLKRFPGNALLRQILFAGFLGEAQIYVGVADGYSDPLRSGGSTDRMALMLLAAEEPAVWRLPSYQQACNDISNLRLACLKIYLHRDGQWPITDFQKYQEKEQQIKDFERQLEEQKAQANASLARFGEELWAMLDEEEANADEAAPPARHHGVRRLAGSRRRRQTL